MIVTQIPDGHVWLRITRPHYTDPFDPSFAQRRWRPLESSRVLADVVPQRGSRHGARSGPPSVHRPRRRTRRSRRRCADPPRRLHAAGSAAGGDVITDAGVEAVGLPSSYPSDADGAQVPHSTTRQIGVSVHHRGLRGRVVSLCGGQRARTGLVPGRSFCRPARLEVAPSLRRLAHRRRSRRPHELNRRKIASTVDAERHEPRIFRGFRWVGQLGSRPMLAWARASVAAATSRALSAPTRRSRASSPGSSSSSR